MDNNLESIYLIKLGKGEHKAYDALFLLYYPKVKNFLLGFVKDANEASDMAQDIFFKVWTHREQIAEVKSLKPYLFRMAKNMVYDHFEHSLVKENYIQKQELSPYYDDIIEDIYAQELESLIDLAVEQMPDQRRRIFTMSRKEGKSNDEIAQQLHINKRTVENHITQALQDIRKAINYAMFFLL